MTAPQPARRRASDGWPPRDEAAQRERLEAFHQELTDQVLALADGSTCKAWLTTAARFHHYSFDNTVAIMVQRPDASRVAGYQTWQSLGRQVRKGEQGIKILAPVTRRKTADADQDAGAKGPATAGAASSAGATTTSLAPESSVEQGPSAPRRIVGVRIAFVFDISQTDPIPGAAPLPEPPARPQLLTGDAPPGLWDGLARQVDEAGFALSMAGPGGGARGRTNHLTHQVEVSPDLESAQQVKTLAHELGHVLLHDPAQLPVEVLHTPGGRGRVELEAESVAYLVTAAHDLDSSDYTFAYVGGWVPDRDALETTLRQTAARVLSTAHTILERFDRDNPDPAVPAEDQPIRLELAPAVGLGSVAGASHGAGLGTGQMPTAPSAAGPDLDGARAALRGGASSASPYASEPTRPSRVDR